MTDVDLLDRSAGRHPPALPSDAPRPPRLHAAGSRAARSRRLIPLAIMVLSFLAFAPALDWRPFTNSMENIVIGSALEARRDGHWLVPTLQGEVRTRKPPLAVWVAAAGVRPGTVAALSDPDAVRRAAAYQRFTWEVRWTALLSSGLALVALYDLGRTVGGPWVGILSPAVAATTLLLLEHARIASYDTQLTLWVTVCNACLARALFRRQYWPGCLGAGAAAGLALMSKGPVALLETVIPVALYVVWRQTVRGRTPGDGASRSGVAGTARRTIVWPALAGVLLAAAVGLPWYGLMVMTYPRIGETWFGEVTRTNAADPRPDPWVVNLKILSVLIPWVVWIAAGLALGGVAVVRGLRGGAADGERHVRRRRRLVFAVFLFVVPFAVMTCFRERKLRYWQPLAMPAAVVAASALVEFGRRQRTVPKPPTAHALTLLHWCVAGGWVIGTPIFGAAKFRTLGGAHWYPPQLAAGAILFGATIVGAGLLLLRRRGPAAGALVALTAAGMLFADGLYQYGDLRSADGRSEMRAVAEAVWWQYPDALVYGDPVGTSNLPLDLSIYLNRVVRPAAELPRTAQDRALVLMVFQRSDAPAPSPPGPSWRRLARAPRGRNYWHAFVLPGGSAR